MGSHGLHLSLHNLIKTITFHSSVEIFFFLSHLQKRKLWASQHDQVFSLMQEGIFTPFYLGKKKILLMRLYNYSKLIMSALYPLRLFCYNATKPEQGHQLLTNMHYFYSKHL